MGKRSRKNKKKSRKRSRKRSRKKTRKIRKTKRNILRKQVSTKDDDGNTVFQIPEKWSKQALVNKAKYKKKI